jgi:GDP-4-dehydro-6-deoxy-D-mannose reductase
MPDSILVTGAAGFAGGHLLDLLTDEGDRVVAWHRPDGPLPASGGGTASAKVSWQPVDLLDREAVYRTLEELRPSAVYHCAGAAHVGRSWESTTSTFAVNVRGTHHLFEGLRRAGIRARVVLPSSALVYASADVALTEDHELLPRSPYALSKLAQEMVGQHAMSGDLHVTIARAFNHLGPRQDPHFAASGFARRIADIEAGRWEAEIAVGNLNARRDLTDVRDTIRAYRLILERGASGRAFNRRPARHAAGSCARSDSRSRGHRPLPSERHTSPRRRPVADFSGARLAASNPARPHPRRFARVLAGAFGHGCLTRPQQPGHHRQRTKGENVRPLRPEPAPSHDSRYRERR